MQPPNHHGLSSYNLDGKLILKGGGIMKLFLQILSVLLFPMLAVHVALVAAVSPKLAKLVV